MFTVINRKPWLSVIPAVAAVAYLNMIRDKVNTIKYRYLDWAITTPLILIALLSANKFPLKWIVALVFADLLMIYFGYKASQEQDDRKRNLNFWISCAAFVPIVYSLVKCKYTKYAKYLTLIIWLLYPIIWYVNNKKELSQDLTTCTYAVMDVSAKVGLVYLLHA
jgi:bacteriorhodopsin